MPDPERNWKRDYLLPEGCKDLFDAIKLEQQANSTAESPNYPPVTRNIYLPKIVAVRFLAETSGQSLWTIAKLMQDLRIGVDVNRNVNFSDAQKILRHFGIWAELQRSAYETGD